MSTTTTTTTTMAMKLAAITLDCADARTLAEFYRQATGFELDDRADRDFASLAGEHGLWLCFQRVDDYQPPRWPGQDAPQQIHLDFAVGDLAEAQDRLLALGASKPDRQPGEGNWLVLVDPAGHPFCLMQR